MEFVQPEARKAPLSRQIMNQFSKCIGLNVHEERHRRAVAEGDGGEVRFFGEIVNTLEAIHKLASRLRKVRDCGKHNPGLPPDANAASRATQSIGLGLAYSAAPVAKYTMLTSVSGRLLTSLGAGPSATCLPLVAAWVMALALLAFS